MTDWNDDAVRQIVVGFDSDWQSRQWLLDGAAHEAVRRKVALTLVTVRPRGGTQDAVPSDGVEALRLMYLRLSIRGLGLDADDQAPDHRIKGQVPGTRLFERIDQPGTARGPGLPVLLIPVAGVRRNEESWRSHERFVLVGIGTDAYDLGVARTGLEEASRRDCDLHLMFPRPMVSGRLDEAERARPWDLVRAAAAGSEGSAPQLSVILTSETPGGGADASRGECSCGRHRHPASSTVRPRE